jgi:hypothetical protein
MSAKSPEGLFIGGVNVLDNPEKVKPTIPMGYLSQGQRLPPILIVHGSKDRLVPFGQSVMMYDALKKFNNEHGCAFCCGGDWEEAATSTLTVNGCCLMIVARKNVERRAHSASLFSIFTLRISHLEK